MAGAKWTDARNRGEGEPKTIASGLASFGSTEPFHDPSIQADKTGSHYVATAPVEMADGSITPIRVFPAVHERSKNRIVVIWPGFGVGAGYYDPIARELARRGYDAAISDLHGQGDSTAKATKRNQFGYHTSAKHDYPRVIAAARDIFSAKESTEVTLLCHSMGGQVACVYLSRPEAKLQNATSGLFVGSGSPCYRLFDNFQHNRLKYGVPFMSTAAKLTGFWPGGRLDIAGYGRQSALHLREWAHFVATGELIPESDDVDYAQAMATATPRLLFTRCCNDEDCPEASARGLMDLMPAADSEFREIDKPYGHNRWARNPKEVCDLMDEWFGAAH